MRNETVMIFSSGFLIAIGLMMWWAYWLWPAPTTYYVGDMVYNCTRANCLGEHGRYTTSGLAYSKQGYFCIYSKGRTITDVLQLCSHEYAHTNYEMPDKNDTDTSTGTHCSCK